MKHASIDRRLVLRRTDTSRVVAGNHGSLVGLDEVDSKQSFVRTKEEHNMRQFVANNTSRLLGGSLALLLALVALALPETTFAQDAGSTFDDLVADGTTYVQAAVVIMWIVAALGFVLLVIAHFFQAVMPSWYNQFRDYARNGIVLLIFVNIVLTYISSQISTAPDFTEDPTFNAIPFIVPVLLYHWLHRPTRAVLATVQQWIPARQTQKA